ncbi:serine hydrolase [Pseudomonas poae]|nr:serine hydrolase [Pseudomonas poae]
MNKLAWRKFFLSGGIAAVVLTSHHVFAVDSKDSVVLPDPQKLFSWTMQEKIIGFSNSAKLFSTEPILKGKTPSALPKADPSVVSRLGSLSYQYGVKADGAPRTNNVDDYIKNNKAAALMVIKDGKVVLEKYADGLSNESLWDGKSVSKSVTSLLMGIALKDGYISSLDDEVVAYIPELAGTAYEGVKLRDMLHMASGVEWNENELDPKSDLSKMLGCVTQADPGSCIVSLMKTVKRVVDRDTGKPIAPGVRFQYNTGDAFLTGLIVQRATQMSLAKYLGEKIWQPYGMEADGNWWSSNGVTSGGSGFNATLRDFGRLGLFVLNNGVLSNGTHVLPQNWIRDSTTWTAASALPHYADNGMYGYMWWFSPAYDDSLVGGTNVADPIYVDIGAPLQNSDASGGSVPVQSRPPVQGQPASISDWTFSAVGIYGQFIAINQSEHLVVVQWSTWDKPDPRCCDQSDPQFTVENPYNEQAVFLNAVIKSLH